MLFGTNYRCSDTLSPALVWSKNPKRLPVVKGDNLSGMISIGDVVREMMAEQKYLIEQLLPYIAG